MSGPADRNGVAGPDDREADEVDALEILRAANGVVPADLPPPDGPRARALYEEIVTMSSDTDHRPATPPRAGARRLALGVAAAAAIGLVTVLAVTLLGGPPAEPEPAPIATDPDPGEVSGGLASCAFAYSAETLAQRELAFEGVIAAVDGDRVTFDVGEVFHGDVADPAVLGGGLLLVGQGTVSTGASDLAVGDRVLVAGDGGFAWACGFTQPYDPAVADTWREAFS